MTRTNHRPNERNRTMTERTKILIGGWIAILAVAALLVIGVAT
jgi:hypothetical protein